MTVTLKRLICRSTLLELQFHKSFIRGDKSCGVYNGKIKIIIKIITMIVIIVIIIMIILISFAESIMEK